MPWIPFFKTEAFSLFHDSKSADENYCSLKTFSLDSLCEMSCHILDFITRSLAYVYCWTGQQRLRFEPGLRHPTSFCCPPPRHQNNPSFELQIWKLIVLFLDRSTLAEQWERRLSLHSTGRAIMDINPASTFQNKIELYVLSPRRWLPLSSTAHWN